MGNTIYSISDASKKINVETHVLRYWEEELGLTIPRNKLGHRYYSEDDLTIFLKIKKLKDDNHSLHEIKDILDAGQCNLLQTKPDKKPAISHENDNKMNQFREIMNQIVKNAIENNNELLASMICENTSERVMKEMNYLFRTLDEDEETRFIQLEAAVGAAIDAKREIAAAKGEKKHFFRRRNR